MSSTEHATGWWVTARGDPRQLRRFGVLVGGVFAAIGAWPAIFRGQDPQGWALVLGTALILLGVMLPRSLVHAYRGWMTLGNALGWINTRILLGVIFYGIVAPMGLCMRLMGKDPMHRGFRRDVETYRVRRQPRPRTHMMRQF